MTEYQVKIQIKFKRKMNTKDKIILWSIGITILCLALYAVSSVMLPFVVALIAAYFLDPAADKLQKLHLSRPIATTIITVSFFIAAIVIFALLAPIFYHQFLNFLNSIPDYITYINDNITPRFSKILDKIDPDALENAKGSIVEASGFALSFIGSLVSNIWNSGIAMLNLLSLLFITPIVTFYMLRDWDKLLAKINSLLPKKYAATIRMQATEINNVLAGYIRGQTHVCLLLGTFYAITLTLAGLEFSLFIGLASGLLLFLPYVGALFGFTVGLIVAFFQFDDPMQIGVIAAIFLAGQILESIFITPNLVGDNVGLHPVWVMFSLLAGGVLLGFLGVLIAVPVAAVIGVLVRFFVGEYLKER